MKKNGKNQSMRWESSETRIATFSAKYTARQRVPERKRSDRYVQKIRDAIEQASG